MEKGSGPRPTPLAGSYRFILGSYLLTVVPQAAGSLCIEGRGLVDLGFVVLEMNLQHRDS